MPSRTASRAWSRLPNIALLALVTAVFLAGGPVQAQSPAEFMRMIEAGDPEAHPDSLAALPLDELMARLGVPGLSLAVIRDFEIHWAKGYGTADVEAGVPVTVETLFQAGSISKPVAAMGVMKAVQDGLFGLDDDINDILTSFHVDGGEFSREHPITPRTLTSHTSGLGDGFGYPGYDPSVTVPTLLQTLEGHELSNTGPVFVERPPMTLAEYSGGGVSVMQQALMDARGGPFPEIMREHVLGPIGMTNSTYLNPLPPEWDRRAARAHSADGESMGAKWHIYPEMAAAGLWTTAPDLARFAIEVQKSALGRSNRVLTRTTVQEMLRPVGVGDFAVGFTIQKRGQGWYFGHGGSDWGFNAWLQSHMSNGYGMAVMTNSDRGGELIREIRRRVEHAYQWDAHADPAPRGYAVPPSDGGVVLDEDVLRSFVGRYRFDGITDLEIELVDGALVGVIGGTRVPMLAVSETTFFVAGFGVRMIFTKGDSGEVVGVSMELGGRPTPGRVITNSG